MFTNCPLQPRDPKKHKRCQTLFRGHTGDLLGAPRTALRAGQLELAQDKKKPELALRLNRFGELAYCMRCGYVELLKLQVGELVTEVPAA